ncbi:MAG: alpha/beta hydrolase [Bacteroidota bacterium]
MKLYFISGLGADHRVFGRMKFEGYECIHLDWIKPLKDESLSEYALRLVEPIDTKSHALIGVSFGGMLVSEIHRQRGSKAAFLISSTPNSSILPSIPSFLLPLFLRKVLFQIGNPIFERTAPFLFGVREKAGKELLKKIISDTDLDFLAWALKAILSWKSKAQASGIIQIHGDSDKLVSAKGQKIDHLLPGGHFIVWEKAEEIEEIIKSHL